MIYPSCRETAAMRPKKPGSSGNHLDNIAFGNLTPVGAGDCCCKAATHFIQQLPQGHDTKLKMQENLLLGKPSSPDHRSSLSTIPKILILDEATLPSIHGQRCLVTVLPNPWRGAQALSLLTVCQRSGCGFDSVLVDGDAIAGAWYEAAHEKRTKTCWVSVGRWWP